MKNACITLVLFAIIILSGIALNLPKPTHTEYLRIHIRANSNLEQDQSIKYLVKNQVVKYLTPFIAECDTKAKAQTLLTSRLSEIEAVANQTLEDAGFDYTAKAKVKKEQFPTRCYGNLELESGVYDALILELGSGTGDNWWCVVYPPLCFVGEGNNVVYKSKVLEIISDFFEKKE